RQEHHTRRALLSRNFPPIQDSAGSTAGRCSCLLLTAQTTRLFRYCDIRVLRYSRGACAAAARGSRAPALSAHPCLIQLSGGSDGSAGGRCWQSHQVPPGHSAWCWRRHGRQIMQPLSADPAASGLQGQPTRSGRVCPAHAAPALGGALIFVQATPGAILLRPGHGVAKAFGTHRAGSTQCLCLALADIPFWLPFPVRAEEEDDLRAAARGGILPAPVRPGRQGNLPSYL